MPLLYRGVSIEMHERNRGALIPKQTNAFTREPEFGVDEWDDCFWGDNPQNAVVHHQRHQVGHPTSGISTTPHLARAEFYSTGGGKCHEGVVYVIDTDRCRELDVTLYVVNDIVPMPAMPEDEEIILVANGNGPLPAGVIVEVRKFAA